jgi:transglutaminase/protease-like cytokinesis protein 3
VTADELEASVEADLEDARQAAYREALLRAEKAEAEVERLTEEKVYWMRQSAKAFADLNAAQARAQELEAALSDARCELQCYATDDFGANRTSVLNQLDDIDAALAGKPASAAENKSADECFSNQPDIEAQATKTSHCIHDWHVALRGWRCSGCGNYSFLPDPNGKPAPDLGHERHRIRSVGLALKCIDCGHVEKPASEKPAEHTYASKDKTDQKPAEDKPPKVPITPVEPDTVMVPRTLLGEAMQTLNLLGRNYSGWSDDVRSEVVALLAKLDAARKRGGA